MARFYASIQGSRGEATRLGGTETGIRGHIRGWISGIRVVGSVNKFGDDEFDVWLTSGNGGRRNEKLIGTFSALNTIKGTADLHAAIKNLCKYIRGNQPDAGDPAPLCVVKAEDLMAN